MIGSLRSLRAKSRLGLLVALTAIAGVAGAGIWWLALPRTPEEMLDAQAREYVLLALGLNEQKSGEVDAYFGPPDILATARERALSTDDISLRARELAHAIDRLELPDEYVSRRGRLLAKVSHLETVIGQVSAQGRLSFAEELATLYGVVFEPGDNTDWQGIVDELEGLLPGTGKLAFRFAAFHNKLVIPPDKRRAVFEAALEECRRRTLQHWKLPDDEALGIDWTRDVSAAWHDYQGNHRSSIRLNDLTVSIVSQAVDLACHEAYPGHHAQFLLMDSHVDGRFALEDTVIMLRSPGSLIREGAANFGVELAFTPQERLEFERDVLFPIAGLPADAAETSFHIHRLVTALSSAAVPVIRDYYDGEVDFNTTSFRLEREAMIASPLPLLEFVDEYGAYSMGYTLLRDLIRREAAEMDEAGRWTLLQRLVVQPATQSIAQLQRASGLPN